MSEVETIAATNAAIAQVDAAAPEVWKAYAQEAVAACAKLHRMFTADEVWTYLEAHGVNSKGVTPSALGPVFLRAAKAGQIENSRQWRKHSKFARRHHELRIWRSLAECQAT